MKRTAAYLMTILLLSSCCEKENTAGTDGQQKHEISFRAGHMTTKASLFNGEDCLYDRNSKGGSFSVYAYVDGSSKEYISGEWVYFFEDNGSWRFRDDMGTPDDLRDDRFINYYWPKNDKLDFFAYMPYAQKTEDTGVTILEYSASEGPRFSCELPLDNGQDNLQEFIYAFSTDQDITTQGEDGTALMFVHPFSAVSFKLIESYRMHIVSIGLLNIHNAGTYSNPSGTTLFTEDNTSVFNSSCWTLSGQSQEMKIEVGKDVPGDMNFHTDIWHPCLVVPQALDNVEFAITYSRDDQDPVTQTIQLKTEKVPSWEPGRKYTYNLTIGDPQEEILFNVLVEEWDVVDYRNENDVE